MSKIKISILFLFIACVSFAQLKHPKASPAAMLTQEVGFTTIKVEYSRPAARGREIFGDLVPFERIWRVGANASTKITIDTFFNVGVHYVSPGTFALYAFPEANEWEIVFHQNTEHWGDGRNNYKPEEDAFRIKVKPKKVALFQENFLISFDQMTHDGVHMIWHWANTRVIIPIRFDTNAAMESQITEKLEKDNPSAQTYYEAARFFIEQGVKSETALIYLNKAIDIGGDTYYFYRVKSLAEAKLKDYTAAVKSARRSMALAEEQDKDEFVRMNQKSIDLWNKKLKIKN